MALWAGVFAMKDNAVCRILGIRFPILQGGMTWVSEAVLAAAVSEAGGLGCIATGNMPGELLREEIRKVRTLTDRPYAVNLILLSPNFKACVDVVREEKVPVVTLGAGNSGPVIAELKAAGVRVVPVVNSVALARRLERSGADAIVAEGEEAGGHIGDTATLPLIPQMVDALKIPVIAAGGVADGRGMAAAFALGAQGIQLGTALVVADESRAHENYKQAVLKASDRSTAVTGRSISKPVRALKNMLTQEFHDMEAQGAPWEEIEGLAVGRLRAAVMEGDVTRGSVMMGQVAGLVRTRGPVRDILRTIVADFNATMDRIGTHRIPAGGFGPEEQGGDSAT
ncbi:MAG: nitronate monooxygenase [Acidobacteriota bacterium]